ncbi:MAG TPA: YciI family protein [Thermoanaerobaculia bacterium]|nr:YciI family protein [Thermoanaerobaculia bacterium]
MKHLIPPLTLSLFLIGLLLNAQEPPPRLAPPPGMKSYFLVLISAEGDAKSLVMSPEGKALFAEHRTFIGRQLAAKNYLLAGPVTDSGPLSGVAVAAARDEKEAREWEEADPLVKSGKFRFEVHAVLLQSLDVLK